MILDVVKGNTLSLDIDSKKKDTFYYYSTISLMKRAMLKNVIESNDYFWRS
jgi:hypothetical protein